MTYCDAQRLPEPREDPYFRIHDFHVLDRVVLIPPKFEADRFLDADEIDFDLWTLTYEIEILKGAEPDIMGITAIRFDGKETHTLVLKGGIYALAEKYLRDDHSRWTNMRDEMLARGEREYPKTRAAA